MRHVIVLNQFALPRAEGGETPARRPVRTLARLAAFDHRRRSESLFATLIPQGGKQVSIGSPSSATKRIVASGRLAVLLWTGFLPDAIPSGTCR